MSGGSFAFGFSLGEQRVELAYGSRSRVFHRPSFTGGYLGTKDAEKVCANEATALFWDVVHPSSYTQCRQAWFFENAFVDAGWIDAAESPEAHRFPSSSPGGRTQGSSPDFGSQVIHNKIHRLDRRAVATAMYA